MTKQKMSGLGRGLGSLIPTKNKTNPVNAGISFGDQQANHQKVVSGLQKKGKEPNGKTVIEVSVDSVAPNPHQPRRDFKQEKLQELADSILEHGIIQPITVSILSDNKYELVAGERRLRASKLAGIEKIPVIIHEIGKEKKAQWALVENIQRDDLNPVEEAWAYKKMKEELSLSQEEVAKKVGKSRSAVANVMRLLALPVEIQKALIRGELTEGHARAILALIDPLLQQALFEVIKKENLTVREAEERARKLEEIGQLTKKVPQADPEVKEKEQQLQTALGTKVKIKKTKKGSGKVVIDFYSEKELRELVEKVKA